MMMLKMMQRQSKQESVATRVRKLDLKSRGAEEMTLSVTRFPVEEGNIQHSLSYLHPKSSLSRHGSPSRIAWASANLAKSVVTLVLCVLSLFGRYEKLVYS